MNTKKYKVRLWQEKSTEQQKRYVVINDKGEIINDCNGLGFRSINGARKAQWYKENHKGDLL